MRRPVYIDHHATTPVDPRVVEAMLPTFGQLYGNAASRDHAFGWQAEELVEVARERVAALIGAVSTEIVFTSGATESVNLAMKGVFEAYGSRGDHIVTGVTEHKVVLDCCDALEKRGARVTRVPVDREGIVRAADVRRALTEQTVLVSIMLANNEIGTLNPVEEIGAIAHERGAIFHCDAAQAVGKVPVDVEAMHIDLLSISAHKFHGPKGVGALYVRRRGPRVRLAPLMHGGGHERGLRPGTLNVPGIVGLGAAASISASELGDEALRLGRLRQRLHERLEGSIDGAHVNGSMEHRLPGNLNVSFEGVDGAALLAKLRDVAVSTGAACTSATPEPSHVLRALGVSDQRARSTLRFGIGRFNTDEEIDFVAERVSTAVHELRCAPSLERRD